MGDFIQDIDDGSHAGGNVSGTKPDVKVYPSSGIDVLIVGAGICGLTAALECYRKGHSVRVYEREPSISTTGK